MSEQIDGFLQMGASYNFERSKLNTYKNNNISSDGFQKWTGPNMYKSSYAHFHSKVKFLTFRILSSLKTQLFQVMEAIFLRLRQKISMHVGTQLWPNRVSIRKDLVVTHMDCLQLVLIWIEMH